ncbi:MAG TPA: PAS domain-containing sensor histidine kinase, partial [Candidatus Dormibacteraeota bacterium]|nr:PAS domain-containing sensor histidine kinase [Candidatus Dormibacteraeota bacterium]
VSLLGTGLVVALRHACRAEEEAAESERRYRFLSDNSFDMIVVFDPTTQRRSYISPAVRRLYGYEPEEAMAMSAAEVIHPDDLPNVNETISRLDEDSDRHLVVYRGRRKDGSYTWVEASLSRQTDPTTGASEVVSIVRDVSERVRYETALREAKEAADAASNSKSRFLATMSHELRTPLNAIIGFAELMQSPLVSPRDSEKYRAYAADIHVSGTHLLHLINDILDLTRIEAGQLGLHEELISVGEVIESVARVSGAEVEKAGLSVKLDLSPELPPLRADERQLRQVLFNLVSNAVKFTPEGGHIEIAARFDPQAGLRITVADTGIGIAPADLPRVLEPFVQVDSSLARQHAGTGLGLPTAKAIMELHGGALELTSAVGVGTEAAAIFPTERAGGGDDRPESVEPAA